MKSENMIAKGTDQKAFIASVGTAVPPLVIEQGVGREFLLKHYGEKLSPRSKEVLNKVFSHPSVLRRHVGFRDFQELEAIIGEDPDASIERFTHWAVELSALAVSSAAQQAGIQLRDIAGLVVNTCTGYLCPGISTYLIEKLHLNPQISAYDLVGSGCGGALPNLQMADAILGNMNGGAVVSVSVEICSATYQMADDLSLIVSNALFGDGAGAAVLLNKGPGLELVFSVSYYEPKYRDAIRYVHKNGQLHNQLSLRLPSIVRSAAGSVVQKLLDSQQLKVSDVAHWAVHPGGAKIIDAVKAELGLSESQLEPTRQILAEYGNVSSATVWFELEEILRQGISPGAWCIMLAFGAGFSIHGFLLRANGGAPGERQN
jgi:predicted naringenin-chalcone synthase